MPRPTAPTSLPSQFTPLIAYLAAQEADTVTLTFAEIETIIGRPVSVSARVAPSLWSGASKRLKRDLRAIGWRARLDVRRHTVEFKRAPVAQEERDHAPP